MLFSTEFNITETAQDDWFDTILDVDTRLFVDPFLIFKEPIGPWAASHARLIEHFDAAFMLIAKSPRPDSLSYKRAVNMMIFREPQEMCLGYTDDGTAGTGSGKGFAVIIARHMANCIARGLGNMEHFEELSIFNKGIGRDRISDAVCTVLKPELVAYTQQVAARHGLPLATHPVYGAVFDQRRQRFEPTATAKVLTNPVNQRPLVLVPRRFLRDLPTLNDRAWFDHHEDRLAREDLSYEIAKNVRKQMIVDRANQTVAGVRRWLKAQEAAAPDPYDEARDRLGLVAWERAANGFTAQAPLALTPPTDQASFIGVIDKIVGQFKLFVEQQGGWALLWDGTEEKPEDAAQLLLYGIARNYCAANNIVVSREVELGRGPVDFTFSNGYTQRAHLEAKKMHNGKFWNGLDLQLPSYMESDAVDLGWFLAIRYRNGKTWDQREAALGARVKAAAAAHGRDLRLAQVDARKPPSASKIKSPKS